jgi:hypothetical protein
VSATLLRRLARVALVLWAGSLWSVLWVTWILFHVQSDRHLAGTLAAPLFRIETYVGLAAVALSLLGRARFVWGYVAAGLMGINEWLLRPVMVAARAHGTVAGLTFGGWHGVSAVLYSLACLALLRLVWNEDLR